MSDLARGERLQIMLTQDELEALDNWRFSRRMPSRAAAVRELLKRGLANEGVELPSGRSRSQDFGVIDSPSEREADGHDGDGRAADGDGLDGHGA
ncbi:MAG: hypothetical protein ACM3YN_06675 [Parcubacteria group bacterium]